VVFNVHGGAWVGGDALLLDTQSQEMADRLGCLVVNINYIKADVKPFPYAQYEVRDTVLYFVRHAQEYGIDTSKLALMGYSAGGHLCACAAQMLAEDGISLSCQVLCYPFLDFTFAGEAHNEMADGMKGIGEIFFPTLSKIDPLVSRG
jgi:acetyl esterase